MRLLAITLALVACGKSGKSSEEGASSASEAPSAAFDCASLLTAGEVETACGAKGSFSKTPAEGKTEAVGGATLKHVCARDIKVGTNGTVSLAIDFAIAGDSTEEIVRGGMDKAGSGDWAKRTPGMTGYVGRPPQAEGQPEVAELHGLVRGTMITMRTERDATTGWACEEAGLAQLGKLVADRVPPAPLR
jgi:hypothetical protein